jgi:hypothetical protein
MATSLDSHAGRENVFDGLEWDEQAPPDADGRKLAGLDPVAK